MWPSISEIPCRPHLASSYRRSSINGNGPVCRCRESWTASQAEARHRLNAREWLQERRTPRPFMPSPNRSLEQPLGPGKLVPGPSSFWGLLGPSATLVTWEQRPPARPSYPITSRASRKPDVSWQFMESGNRAWVVKRHGYRARPRFARTSPVRQPDQAVPLSKESGPVQSG